MIWPSFQYSNCFTFRCPSSVHCKPVSSNFSWLVGSSRRQENFVIEACCMVLSISSKDYSQKWTQFVNVPSNLDICNFGNFAFWCFSLYSLYCSSSYLPVSVQHLPSSFSLTLPRLCSSSSSLLVFFILFLFWRNL